MSFLVLFITNLSVRFEKYEKYMSNIAWFWEDEEEDNIKVMFEKVEVKQLFVWVRFEGVAL